MIIKIKINEGMHETHGDSWFYVDGAKNITTRRQFRPELVESGGDSRWYERYGDAHGDAHDYVLIGYEEQNGTIHSIITDCPTYLLNDTGKTIERIY